MSSPASDLSAPARLSIEQPLTWSQIELALESICEAIVWTDAAGRVVGTNTLFDRLCGTPGPAALGQELKPLLQLSANGRPVSPDRHPVERTLQGESDYFGEFELAHPYRSPCRVRVSGKAAQPTGEAGAAFVIRETTQEWQKTLELEHKSVQLELLQDVAFASNNSNSACDAMQYSLSRLADYQGWPLGHIWLLEPGQRELTASDLWHCTDWSRFGPFMAASRLRTFAPGTGLPGRALSRRRPTWVVDIQKDENFPRKAEADRCGLRSGFAFPVVAGEAVAAVLELYSESPIEPDEQLLMVVDQMSALLSRTAEREIAAIEKRQTLAGLEERVLERTSALEQVNRSLKAEVEQRRQAERVKDEFVATVSHELRTPLAGIHGFAELLVNREFSKERGRQMHEVILKESVQLTELIDDLLDVQRLAVGELTYRRQRDLDLLTVVEEAVEGAQAQTNQHTISIEAAGEPPRIDADPARIRQVLNNLLSNAIRYSPQGGAIRIWVGEADEFAEVRVRDEGIGIPADLIGNLFTKFYRVDDTATRSVNGTGLGLALIKSIVKDHGGEVGVESVEGKGSTFWFRLPSSES